jgi:uncharacterized protein YecE (DUF72 family)
LFDTVELNTTFYRLPAASSVDRWAGQAPAGFVYSLKLGAFGSHRMKLRDAASWLPNHVERAGRLGASLGPTVVQLPPRWRRNVERLDEFLSVADGLPVQADGLPVQADGLPVEADGVPATHTPSGSATAAPGPRRLRWAVELREPSWLHDDVFDVLRRHGAALCLHDLLPDHPWVLTADWTYLRFHGPEALQRKYWGRYGGRRLWRTADRLAGWLADGYDVYAYFNNDHEGHAAEDARWLRGRLARSLPAAPAPHATAPDAAGPEPAQSGGDSDEPAGRGATASRR